MIQSLKKLENDEERQQQIQIEAAASDEVNQIYIVAFGVEENGGENQKHHVTQKDKVAEGLRPFDASFADVHFGVLVWSWVK